MILKFHVFHITLGGRNKNIFLKGHTLEMSPENLESIPEVIISIIQLQNGRKIDEILEQWDEIKRPVINSALSQLAIYSDDEGMSLEGILSVHIIYMIGSVITYENIRSNRQKFWR